MAHADLILENVQPFVHGQPLAGGQAVATAGGRITGVGPVDKLAPLRGPGTKTIDLDGRVLLPGFSDAHLHLALLGQALRQINLHGTATRGEVLEAIKDGASRTAPDTWLLGRGWEQRLWGDAFPTKEELDRVTVSRCAAFQSKCGHITWANSAALARAKVGRDTPDPPGGEIERGADGEPTGILKERAAELVRRAEPAPDAASLQEDLRAAVREAHRFGVTSVTTFPRPEELDALYALAENGELPLRVDAYLRGDIAECFKRLDAARRHPPEKIRNLRVLGIKAFVDGSLGGQTALMFEPYEHTGGCGIGVTHGEELTALVRRATEAGAPCTLHAIGDRAVSEALDAIAASRTINPALRHRIEHAQVLRAEDIPRFKASGAIASMQPVHLYGDREPGERYWGTRCAYAFALKSLLESGARVCFGTDAPVERLDPMPGLFAACAREQEEGGGAWHAEQCIGLDTAVWCYTAESAYAAHAEGTRGALMPGLDADFAIVRADFFDMPLRELLSTKVELTVFDGQVMHGA